MLKKKQNNSQQLRRVSLPPVRYIAPPRSRDATKDDDVDDADAARH